MPSKLPWTPSLEDLLDKIEEIGTIKRELSFRDRAETGRYGLYVQSGRLPGGTMQYMAGGKFVKKLVFVREANGTRIVKKYHLGDWERKVEDTLSLCRTLEQASKGQEESTSPPLASFVLLFLARILETVAHFPKDDRKRRHANILKGIAAETFIIGGAIGAERPDLVPRIFKQCCDEPEQAMKEARILLNEILSIYGLRLESLPFRMTGYAAETLQDRLPSHRPDDWDQTLYNAVTITSFLPGCVLGCEHMQLFWDMLQRELRRTIEEDSLPLAVQMNLFYGTVLSEESKRVLEALKHGVLEMPVQKLGTLYQEIAGAILANYERESGSLPI